jgi:hypothetical protein
LPPLGLLKRGRLGNKRLRRLLSLYLAPGKKRLRPRSDLSFSYS